VKFNPKKKKLTNKQKMFIVREQHIVQNTKVEDIALNTLTDNPGSKKPVKQNFKTKTP
jgi:large subunit ribosomal protein L15